MRAELIFYGIGIMVANGIVKWDPCNGSRRIQSDKQSNFATAQPKVTRYCHKFINENVTFQITLRTLRKISPTHGDAEVHVK